MLLGLYRAPYLTEYGFLVIILGVAITLADRFCGLHNRVEALNQSLRERTFQVRASERRYRGLFENAKDGILLFDQDGKGQMVNPYLRTLAGLLPAPDGLPDLRGLFPGDGEAIEKALRLLAEGSAERFDLEVTLSRRDGTTRDISLGISMVEKNAHTFLYQGIARDITTQKELTKKLLRQDRISSLGVLAGGVAHEFNNILTSISGFAQLARHAKGPEEVEPFMAMILQEVRRATDLSGNMLRFAGAVPGDGWEEVHVATLLDRSLNLVERELDKAGIRIARDYGEAPWILSNPASLEQVLVNLYLNARDALSEGGTLTVRARCLEDQCVIEVEDDGPGIPPEDLHRIFDPFYTTKGPRGHGRQRGTGLGLSICHGILQELGGEISAENLHGGGARFTVVLPRSGNGAAKARA